MKPIITVLSLLFAVSAWAAPANIDVEQVSLSTDYSTVEVRFADREPVAAACDYHVTRFEYVEAAQILVVDLRSPEPCLLDRFGRRKGRLTWELPAALRSGGRLGVILNGTKLGEIQLGKE